MKFSPQAIEKPSPDSSTQTKSDLIFGSVGFLLASFVYHYFLVNHNESDLFMGIVSIVPAIVPGIVLGLTAIILRQKKSIAVLFSVAVLGLPIMMMGILLLTPYALIGVVGSLALVPTNLLATAIGIVLFIVLKTVLVIVIGRERLESEYFFKRFQLLVLGILVIGTAVSAAVIAKEEYDVSNLVQEEQDKRSSFIENVLRAATDDRLKTYSTNEVVELGLADGIYQISDGEIIHGFGGSVELELNGETLSLTYNSIPNGEACHRFYFFHLTPEYYGFEKLSINGIEQDSFPSHTATGMSDFRKATCDDEQYELNTFIHKANLSDFKSRVWTLK